MRKKSRKTSSGLPTWLKCVPEGLHGSGTLQKRLWRLTSDYCRIRDWLAWDGRCIATGMTLYDWNDGQGGHYRGYTTCNGMFKFHPINIHLQSAQSNSWPTSRTWEVFAENLKNRHGRNIIETIDMLNQQSPLKITTALVMEDIERKIALIEKLPQKPPYWNRLTKLRATTLLEELQKA